MVQKFCAYLMQAERHRLEAALQEAAFLRGRIAAMEHAGSSHQHEQQQVCVHRCAK